MLQTFSRYDLDQYLYGLFSGDALMPGYSPGGFFAEHPPQGSLFPCVRWWFQSHGKDIKRQDGQLGAVGSEPNLIICMLDRQRAGQISFYNSTAGAGLLKAGAERIYTLLHGKCRNSNGFLITANAVSEYSLSDSSDGDHDVLLGYWFQFFVQH